MAAAKDTSFTRALPRTTSPIITLLQKKRALNKENQQNILDNKPKYSFNFNLNTYKPAIQTNMKEPTYTNKSPTPTPTPTHKTPTKNTTPTHETPTKNTTPSHKTPPKSPTQTFRSPTSPSKPSTHFHTPYYNNTRYTPTFLGMDNIRENIVNSSKKSDSRDPDLPDATYHHERFNNRPSSIEFYEPGSSSLSKTYVSSNPSHLIPMEKPEDLCRYIVSPTSQRYNVTKSNQQPDEIPPLRPPTPHGVYMSVQKGGDVPLEGLYCPPFYKPDLSISTRKSRWYKDMLNKIEKPNHIKTFTTPCLPVPRSSSTNRQSNKEASAEHVSLCELLATNNLNCKDRRSRDEINKARKLQMDLYIKSAKLKKKIEEDRDNENRRHSDNGYGRFCKSPVTLDRYDLEDDAFTSPTPSPIHPRPFPAYPTYKARVLYNFHAKDTKELTLQKDEVVLVWGVVDDNWMKGEHHGSVGIFPASYVQIFHSFDFPQSFSSGQLFHLLYNFKARTSEEINLKKGDVVRVLERISNDWLKVEMVKPSHILDRSPENRFFHNSPSKPQTKTIYNSFTTNNPSQPTNALNRDLHSVQTGLVPPTYLIPLERNIDTIKAFPHNSPHEHRTKTGPRMNAFMPTNSSWKEIPKVVVGVGQKGLFFTDDNDHNYSNINWRTLNKPNLHIIKSKSNGHDDGNVWNEKDYLGLKSKSSDKLDHENNGKNNLKYNYTNYINKNRDLDNDFYIDESYMADLDALNASIDPLFYLNLSKLKPPLCLPASSSNQLSKIL